LDNQATNSARNLEKLIGLYGSNGYAVGESLTWADLAIVDVVTSFFNRRQNFLSNFPLLSKVYEKSLENERVAQYLASRPGTDNLEVEILKAFANH
jgi:glutathione S-transferase